VANLWHNRIFGDAALPVPHRIMTSGRLQTRTKKDDDTQTTKSATVFNEYPWSGIQNVMKEIRNPLFLSQADCDTKRRVRR
jgi:hypothetical protein